MAPKRKEPAAGDRARAKRRIEKEFLLPHVVPGFCFTVGSSDFGALGLGEDVTEKYRAAHVDVDGKKLVSVVCGGMHTVALAEDGSVYTWGVNDEGALGRPTSGTAWEKEDDSTKEDAYVPGRARIPDGVSVVQVAAGDGFTFALSDEGAIYGWGQFKDDVSSFNNFTPEVRLQRLPAVYYQPADIRDRVRKLSAGARHMAALTRRGEVLTWGLGGQGQLGRLDPFDTESFPSKEELLTPKPVDLAASIGTDIVDIGTGNYATFAINKRGAVAAWGLNNGGQLGLPIAEAAEGAAAVANGTAADADANGDAKQQPAVEHRLWEPTAVPALSKGIAAVAGGEHHSLALTKQHKVLSFGATTYGMLGRMDVPKPEGTETLTVPEPLPVDETDGLEAEQAISIAAGMHMSACVTARGNLFTWGSNTSFQLAKGQDEDDSLVPTRMRRHKAFGQRKVLQFSFGGQHAAMLASEDETPAANGAAAAAPASAGGAGTSAAAEAAAAPAAAAEPEQPAAEAAAAVADAEAAETQEGAGESDVPAPAAAARGKRAKKEPAAKAPAAKRTRKG